MDQIGNTEVSSSEEKSPLSTHLICSSDFNSQSVDSTQSSSSCEIRGTSAELRALDGSYPTCDDNINEVTVVDLLMEKIRIPHIFLGILGLLDKESLRHARLVSTKWNNFALEILSKIAGRVQFWLERGNDRETKESDRIKKLLSILNLTEDPAMFFTRLILVAPMWVHFCPEKGLLVPLVQELHLNLLSQFGSTLKSLELRNIYLHLSIVSPLIEIWCVNLEELTIADITVLEDKKPCVQSVETWPTPLELNLRKIRFLDGDDSHARDMIILTIKSSPKLKCFHGFVHNEESDFWSKFESLPALTDNLENVFIGTLEAQDIIWLNGISFSNKLTCLTLDMREPSFPKEQLLALLGRVAESLEKLTLHMSMNYWDEADVSYWKIELPWMTKLKVLEHTVDFAEHFCFHSIDFLKMTPNLEILGMANSIEGYPIEGVLMDAFFLNSSYLIMCPHTKLNSLSLKGSPKSLETIPAINRIFPNLRQLSLHFDMDKIPATTEKETWLTSNFKGLSEMKNLKILKVHFHEGFKLDLGINFENSFSPLEASKSLEELTIGRYRESTEDVPFLPPDFLSVSPKFKPHLQDFPPGLAKIFVKIPKLKVLRLKGFQMGSSDSRTLFNTLEQRGISLFY